MSQERVPVGSGKKQRDAPGVAAPALHCARARAARAPRSPLLRVYVSDNNNERRKVKRQRQEPKTSVV